MKKLIVAILCILVCLSFSGCSLLYDYQVNAVDSFDVGYSRTLDDAFLASYNWDGTEETMKLVIPETYRGIPITTLGGYYGRGVPCSFVLEPTEAAKEKLFDEATEWFSVSDIRGIEIEIDEINTFNFDVHISKNIEKIEMLNLGSFVCGEYVKNGTTCYKVFVLLCTITCDEDNEVFYAKDGKLYYRQNDTLVTDICYYDLDLDSFFNEKLEEDAWFNAF